LRVFWEVGIEEIANHTDGQRYDTTDYLEPLPAFAASNAVEVAVCGGLEVAAEHPGHGGGGVEESNSFTPLVFRVLCCQLVQYGKMDRLTPGTDHIDDDREECSLA